MKRYFKAILFAITETFGTVLPATIIALLAVVAINFTFRVAAETYPQVVASMIVVVCVLCISVIIATLIRRLLGHFRDYLEIYDRGDS